MIDSQTKGGEIQTLETNLRQFREKLTYNKNLISEVELEAKNFAKTLKTLKLTKNEFYYTILLSG